MKDTWGEISILLGRQQPEKSLELLEKYNSTIETETIDNQITYHYYKQLCYKHLSEQGLAEMEFNKGLKLAVDNGMYLRASDLMRDHGLVYEYLGRYPEAIAELTKAISLASRLSRNKTREYFETQGINYVKRGWVRLLSNELLVAKRDLIKGIGLLKNGQNIFNKMTAMLHLSLFYLSTNSIYEAQGAIISAKRYYKIFCASQNASNLRRRMEIDLIEMYYFYKISSQKQSFAKLLEAMKVILLVSNAERKRFFKQNIFNSVLKQVINIDSKKFSAFLEEFSKSNINKIDWNVPEILKDFV